MQYPSEVVVRLDVEGYSDVNMRKMSTQRCIGMHLDRGPRLVKFRCIILERFGAWLGSRTKEFREVVHLDGLSAMDSVKESRLRVSGSGPWCYSSAYNHNQRALCTKV